VSFFPDPSLSYRLHVTSVTTVGTSRTSSTWLEASVGFEPSDVQSGVVGGGSRRGRPLRHEPFDFRRTTADNMSTTRPGENVIPRRRRKFPWSEDLVRTERSRCSVMRHR